MPISEVEVGKTYYSQSGRPFKVRGRSWYGLNCSIPMIEYTNLEPTADKPAGHKWVIEESLFLKNFSE